VSKGWQEVTAPKVLSKVEPVYTGEARSAGLKGFVILEAVIKNDRTVGAIRVVQGLELGLTNSAIDALKQFKFSPGKKDGQDVDAVLKIGINFRLPSSVT
jgi:TonB family protein